MHILPPRNRSQITGSKLAPSIAKPGGPIGASANLNSHRIAIWLRSFYNWQAQHSRDGWQLTADVLDNNNISGVIPMSVARTTEITATSTKSFNDALNSGVKRSVKTLDNVTGAWIKDQEVEIKNGKITSYRVRMMVTFILK